jgi:V8-like Glu-specific endopeptidase
MEFQKKSLSDCSVEELDRELIARGARAPEEKRFQFPDRTGTPGRNDVMKQINELYNTAVSLPPDRALSHITTDELLEIILFRTRNAARGIWGKDQRMDCYQVIEEPVEKNASSVAAICSRDDLIKTGSALFELKVKTFGTSFNLCPHEPFYHQPIAAGPFCTGFLVGEDMIAAAGHCVDEKSVTDLRVVFDYRMLDSHTPATRVPSNKVYKVLKLMDRAYQPRGNRSDWALVKLDRKVEGLHVTTLSKREIASGHEVYVMGYPCGLPLKYAPGARVGGVNDTYFTADLDIYCGSSGSPVFDSITHEVVGMVVRGHDRDFRWSGKCWVSVIYRNSGLDSRGAQCTKVTEFIRYC